MVDTTVGNLTADSVQTTELQARNVVVTGAARFAQPIYTAGIQNSEDLNQVTASASIPDSYYVIISDGSSLKRITFSDLCAAVANKIGIDTTKTYLVI